MDRVPNRHSKPRPVYTDAIARQGSAIVSGDIKTHRIEAPALQIDGNSAGRIPLGASESRVIVFAAHDGVIRSVKRSAPIL